MGGESDAEVSRLFTWVYGWVGVALISAFVFPIWTWLDPFSTLHDIGARGLRAAGIAGIAPATYPARLGRWPAAVGFAAVVWLELVAMGAGSRTLALVITGYSVFTLAMMAQYGRRTWSEHGEIFGVWFRLLGRLAPFVTVADGEDGRLRRRDFASGLLEGGAAPEDVVIIGLGDRLHPLRRAVADAGLGLDLRDSRGAAADAPARGLPRAHRGRGARRRAARRGPGDGRGPPPDRRGLPPGPLLHLPR